MAPQAEAEAPHIAGVVPMEDLIATTLSSVDHPATALINAAPSFVGSSVESVPSLATNAGIGTTSTADHSTTSLIGGVPLSLVNPSAIPSLVTEVSMAIDHSSTHRCHAYKW